MRRKSSPDDHTCRHYDYSVARENQVGPIESLNVTVLGAAGLSPNSLPNLMVHDAQSFARKSGDRCGLTYSNVVAMHIVAWLLCIPLCCRTYFVTRSLHPTTGKSNLPKGTQGEIDCFSASPSTFGSLLTQALTA